MRKTMKIVMSLGALMIAGSAMPQTTPADAFKHLSAQELAALVTKPGVSPVSAKLADHENYYVVLAGRTASGEVEVHAHWTDLMTILAGEAELTYGGAVSGHKTNEQGESLGGTISGGKTITLRAGDYFQIPAGMPHLMTLKPGANFRYLVVKQRV